MTFEYEERPSASRFVDVIWRTHDTSDARISPPPMRAGT
jgi:hypothetical protein